MSLSVIAGAMLTVFRQPHSAQRNAAVSETASQPRLQDNPAGDLAAYDAEKRALLTNYAWIDRGRGTLRIPIDHAMDIIAHRHAQPNGAVHP
jgi:hypothetical protein